MNLRITKKELEWLILWASEAKHRASEVKVPFEQEEERLIEKLKEARRKIWNKHTEGKV